MKEPMLQPKLMELTERLRQGVGVNDKLILRLLYLEEKVGAR